MMRKPARPIDILAVVLYGILVIVIPIRALRHPFHNWDMLVYVGSAVRYEADDDPAQVHARTFGLVREAVSPDRWQALTTENAYRRDVAGNPGHFVQQLTFARLRPAYVLGVYLLGRVGISLVTATVLISAVAGAVLAALLMLWLACYLRPFHAALAGALLISAADLGDVARLSTADALSALVVTGAFMVLVHGRRPLMAGLLLAATITVRSDNIVVAGVTIAALTFTGVADLRLAPRRGLALLGVCAATYLAVSWSADNYPWWTLLVHSFVGPLTTPAAFEERFELARYARLMFERLSEFRSPAALLFGMLAAATLVVNRMQHRVGGMARSHSPGGAHAPAPGVRTAAAVTAVILVTAAVRFVLFPVISDRFNLPLYAIITIMLVLALTHRRPSEAGTRGPLALAGGFP